MKKRYFELGQAVLEYLLVLALTTMIGTRILFSIRDFFDSSLMSISYVLSSHLSVGVCSVNCVFKGYANGEED